MPTPPMRKHGHAAAETRDQKTREGKLKLRGVAIGTKESQYSTETSESDVVIV